MKPLFCFCPVGLSPGRERVSRVSVRASQGQQAGRGVQRELPGGDGRAKSGQRYQDHVGCVAKIWALQTERLLHPRSLPHGKTTQAAPLCERGRMPSLDAAPPSSLPPGAVHLVTRLNFFFA